MNRKNLLKELMERYSFEKAHSIIQIATEDRKFENDDMYIVMTRTLDGDIFDFKWKNMTKERRADLLNNMLEYLDNYGVELEYIGVYDDIKDEVTFDECLDYIVELVGCDGNKDFFEGVLGFTKEELIAEGIEWVYK